MIPPPRLRAERFAPLLVRTAPAHPSRLNQPANQGKNWIQRHQIRQNRRNVNVRSRTFAALSAMPGEGRKSMKNLMLLSASCALFSTAAFAHIHIEETTAPA